MMWTIVVWLTIWNILGIYLFVYVKDYDITNTWKRAAVMFATGPLMWVFYLGAGICVGVVFVHLMIAEELLPILKEWVEKE